MFGVLSTAGTAQWWDNFDALATAVGFAIAVVTSIGWAHDRFRLRGLSKARSRLEQRNNTLLLDYNEALKENDRLVEERDQWVPAVWIAGADKETASGNDFKAVDILDQGYQRVREDLGIVLHRLAEYHASRMIGSDAVEHHSIARRLSKVAADLAPSRREILRFARDLDCLEISDGEPLQLASSRFDAGSVDEALRVINAIISTTRGLAEQGRHLAGLALCNRALRLVRRHGLEGSDNGLAVWFHYARALFDAGQNADAAREVEDLLPMVIGRRGAEHPDVLEIRYLDASITVSLGHYEEAIAKIQEQLVLEEKVRGSESINMLSLTYLEARALSAMGHDEEALHKINKLLPLDKRVMGEESHEYILNRHLEGVILQNLGRFDEVLVKTTAILPLAVRVLGCEHPDTIAIRQLKAAAHLGLHDFEAAKKEIEIAIPIQAAHLGEDHEHTLVSELIRLKILAATDRVPEAKLAIPSLVARLEKATGPEHFQVKHAIAFRDHLSSIPARNYP